MVDGGRPAGGFESRPDKETAAQLIGIAGYVCLLVALTAMFGGWALLALLGWFLVSFAKWMLKHE